MYFWWSAQFSVKFHFLFDSSKHHPRHVQNALYGLGLCAERGGSVFKPFVRGMILLNPLMRPFRHHVWSLINPMISEALSRINVVITHSNALEPENIKAYNYAVSALGKICHFHRENIDSEQVCFSGNL